MPEIIITVNANMDSKEGIEKVAPVDAQAAELLDPSFLRPETHDATTADPPRKWAGSLTGSCISSDEHPRRESNCLYVRVLRDSDAILEQDRKVPEYCWNASISKDICEAQTGVVPGTFSLDLLSDTEFLVYHVPKTTRGMSDREARCYADLIMGSYLWAGSLATVFVTKRTTQEARRDKVKTREYRQKITVQRLATAQARLKDLEMVTQKCQERTMIPVARGRGMIRRADKYLAQGHGKEPERIPGMAPVLPAFSDRAATLDDYHSAWEPSESEYNSEEMDPEEDRDDVEGDDDDVSVGSDATFKSSSHDMDRTNRTTTANRTQRRNQRKRKESRGRHPTNARKEDERRKGKVVLSLFRDSPKEGTLTYTDWRHEVEEYIGKGYDDNRIKDAMLSSVEGQAYVNFCSCHEGRNRTPAQNLKEMDSIYNVSITFWDLNAQMCGLKQRMNEPIKTYYERMADISVKLEQYHGDRFGSGELKMMKKDCFYAGLNEHNKYLVSHMKDREQYGPAQMLREIWEQEDSCYLANTSPKPHHTDSGNKNTSHYNKNLTYDKPRAYTVRHTNVQIPDQGGDEPDLSPTNDIDPDEICNEGYYIAVINTANEADKWGRCFNYGKEGHRWAECKEPLKESLKLAKERANRKKQALNRDGGVGTKGAQPPRWVRPRPKTSRPTVNSLRVLE